MTYRLLGQRLSEFSRVRHLQVGLLIKRKASIFVLNFSFEYKISFTYKPVVMYFVCLRGDNPRALASRISPVQADKLVELFYVTLINVDLAQYEIFHANVCDIWQSGIKYFTLK